MEFLLNKLLTKKFLVSVILAITGSITFKYGTIFLLGPNFFTHHEYLTYIGALWFSMTGMAFLNFEMFLPSKISKNFVKLLLPEFFFMNHPSGGESSQVGDNPSTGNIASKSKSTIVTHSKTGGILERLTGDSLLYKRTQEDMNYDPEDWRHQWSYHRGYGCRSRIGYQIDPVTHGGTKRTPAEIIEPFPGIEKRLYYSDQPEEFGRYIKEVSMHWNFIDSTKNKDVLDLCIDKLSKTKRLYISRGNLGDDELLCKRLIQQFLIDKDPDFYKRHQLKEGTLGWGHLDRKTVLRKMQEERNLLS